MGLAPDHDDEGVHFEDGRLTVRDGRTLAWRVWGRPEDPPVLRLQGTVGSRLSRGPDPTVARLRVVMADRPGFGSSSRLPGRGLRVVGDDLIELLDFMDITALPVVAHSGGVPHALALAAGYSDRVRSVTALSGACPLLPAERPGLVRPNAELGEVLDKGWEAVHEYLTTLSPSVLADGSDCARAEALRDGAAGWTDETLAITGTWDFDLSDVAVAVEWWHGTLDTTVPLSAVRRLTAQLPQCYLHVVEGGSHHLGLASTLLAKLR